MLQMLRQLGAVLCISVLAFGKIPWDDYESCTVPVGTPAECESVTEIKAFNKNLIYEIIRSSDTMCCAVAQRTTQSDTDNDMFTKENCTIPENTQIMRFSVPWKSTGKPKIRCYGQKDDSLGTLAGSVQYGVMWRARKQA